jgi:hypothetical protein
VEIEDVWEALRKGRARRLALLLSLAPSILASCGAGVAAVAASAGGSSGDSTPALNAFEVETPKVSPTRLRFDASQAVRVALFFDAGAPAGEQAMAELDGVASNEVSLPAGESFLKWDFATELGTARFKPGVRLVARVPGGPPISGGELLLGMGNDPPEIEAVVPPPEEVSGVVPVGVRVSDTSSDIVSISVEWKRASEPPDAWKPATPASAFPGEDPFQGVEAPMGGVELSFFWSTDSPLDLHDLEDEVLVRFTPDDGTPTTTGSARASRW